MQGLGAKESKGEITNYGFGGGIVPILVVVLVVYLLVGRGGL